MSGGVTIERQCARLNIKLPLLLLHRAHRIVSRNLVRLNALVSTDHQLTIFN